MQEICEEPSREGKPRQTLSIPRRGKYSQNLHRGRGVIPRKCAQGGFRGRVLISNILSSGSSVDFKVERISGPSTEASSRGRTNLHDTDTDLGFKDLIRARLRHGGGPVDPHRRLATGMSGR